MTEFNVAEAQIRQLHARYTDAVFRHDYAAFADCFMPEGEWRISGMVLKGREEIQSTIARILANFDRVLISFGTPILEVGDGSATGRTYVTEKCAWKNGERSTSIGRYYERFVADGKRWRFAWRLFQLHYRGPADLTGTFYDNPDFGALPGMPQLDAGTMNHAAARWKLQT
jgi:ketosteroid isomerase-like protein